MNLLKRIFGGGSQSRAPMPQRAAVPDPTSFVESVFAFDLAETPEPRNWQNLDELKDVPALFREKKISQVEAKLDAALTKFPDYSFVFNWQASVFEERGEIDQARRAYTEGIGVSREKRSLCGQLAMLEFKHGKLKEAVRWWIRSIFLQMQNKSVDDAQSFLYLAFVALLNQQNEASSKLMEASAKGVHGTIALSSQGKQSVSQKVNAEPCEEIRAAIQELTTRRWTFKPAVKKTAASGKRPTGDEIEAFHQAVWNGNLEKVETLLAGNPNLASSTNDDGQTPLHAVQFGDRNGVVRLLLAYKADVNAKGEHGNTPLAAMVHEGLEDIAEVLLTNGADVNARNSHHCTPLHGAGNRAMVQLLVAYKAEVNAKDNGDDTPLHKAAMRGDIDAAAALLVNGANPNAKNKEGHTPLDSAVAGDWHNGDRRWEQVAQLLRKHGT